MPVKSQQPGGVIRVGMEVWNEIVKIADARDVTMSTALELYITRLTRQVREEAEERISSLEKMNDRLYHFLSVACEKLRVVVPKEVRRENGGE